MYMHSRSYKALCRVLLTRTQVVIQVLQWHFKVVHRWYSGGTQVVQGGTMELQGAWLTRRRIWNLSTLSCPLCSVHLLLISSTVSWVFVFVHSYLYLSIRVCICAFVFVSHALLYSDTFSSATFSVKFFLPSSCGHFWLWCWFQMCCCTPVRISHNRERDSSATYHMPNYLWQICPLWSFLWQIIFAHPAPAVWSYSQGFNQGTLVLKGWN